MSHVIVLRMEDRSERGEWFSYLHSLYAPFELHDAGPFVSLVQEICGLLMRACVPELSTGGGGFVSEAN